MGLEKRVDMEEYREHVGEISNKLVKLGCGSYGMEDRFVMQGLNARVLWKAMLSSVVCLLLQKCQASQAVTWSDWFLRNDSWVIWWLD